MTGCVSRGEEMRIPCSIWSQNMEREIQFGRLTPQIGARYSN